MIVSETKKRSSKPVAPARESSFAGATGFCFYPLITVDIRSWLGGRRLIARDRPPKCRIGSRVRLQLVDLAANQLADATKALRVLAVAAGPEQEQPDYDPTAAYDDPPITTYARCRVDPLGSR